MAPTVNFDFNGETESGVDNPSPSSTELPLHKGAIFYFCFVSKTRHGGDRVWCPLAPSTTGGPPPSRREAIGLFGLSDLLESGARRANDVRPYG